jgi:glycosyltransferase involved in cell wall biosynthesis
MAALRIGIEAHVVGPRPSGNGRVVANLISSLAAETTHELFAYFTDRSTTEAWLARRIPNLTPRLVRPRTPFVRIPLGLPLAAARDRLDVFLAHDNRPPIAPCPVVTLVHDVAFARHPEFFSPYERLWMRRTIPASIRHSRGIVTVSNFTRDEIVDLYGISPDRITVAPNGVDPIFFDPVPDSPSIEPPFFVAVGNVQPRKNLATLIAAFRSLLSGRPGLRERLVIVGQRAFGAERLVEDTGDLQSAGRLVFAGYVPDAELVGLLRHATAFAYPSVYEGFGLPPLEAMAAGAPTLVSDIPVMREVVGDAAIRVDPHDAERWAEELWRVASDEALRAKLNAGGRDRAKSFTWRASALAVADALERAASG